jgi:hypothetical protein
LPAAGRPAIVPAMRKNTVVLLDVPRGTARIDLGQTPTQEGFRGFSGVPDGLHRVEASDGRLRLSTWLFVDGGETAVRAADPAVASLVEADGFRAAQYMGLKAEGGLDQSLVPYPTAPNTMWSRLVAPLKRETFPPELRQDPQGKGTRLERALEGTHKGEPDSFLEELAWSWLAGHVDGEQAARGRWEELVDAVHACGPRTPARNEEMFVKLVDLLIAQREALPEGTTPPGGVQQLVDSLVACEAKPLVAAGEKLRGHLRAAVGR